MADPYHPPAAPSADPIAPPLTTRELVFALVLPILSALGVFVLVPQFADVYRGFGTELPLPTHLLVNWHGLVWLWPLVVAGVFARFRRHRRGRTLLSVASIAGSGTLVLIAGWAAYLPLMMMAETI